MWEVIANQSENFGSFATHSLLSLDLEYCDLDLSEEFLSEILKQVDELCDAIKNGDPNLEQTTIVNQNLNNAVSVYRDKLFLFETKCEETISDRNYCDDCPIDSDKESLENNSDTEHEPVIKKKKTSKSTDNDYNSVPKKRGKYNKDKNKNSKDNEIRKVQLLPYLKYKDKNKVVECSLCNETFLKKDEFFKHLRSMHTREIMEKLDNSKPEKRFRRPDEHISEMIELVKSQCGNHSVPSMARTLKMPKCTIFNKIKQQSIVFSKHEGDCHFCKMKKNMVKNDESKEPVIDSSTFLCLRYNKEEKMLYCSICKKSASGTHDGRTALLRHIKNNHQKAIEIEKNNMKKKNECENHVCRETYGLGQQQLWCQLCDELYKNKPKPIKPKLSSDKDKLCPECGKSVSCLKTHINTTHSKEIHICLLCEKEFGSIHYLKKHHKASHGEKVPCIHCGKLYGTLTLMNRHIQAQHTADNKKKHQCDICGKGFNASQNLKDHINIHNGEKPYNCKYCNACFASGGNHAQHERGHEGFKRNGSK